MTKTVWILSPDNYTEGLGEPWLAFETEEECDALLHEMDRLPASQIMRKSEVQVWNPQGEEEMKEPGNGI